MKTSFKKVLALLMILSVMLPFVETKSTKAASTQVNATEEIVWGNSYVSSFIQKELSSFIHSFSKYTFTLPESGKVSFVGTVEKLSSSTPAIELTIYDASGKEIYDTDFSEGNGSIGIDLLKGNYSVEIGPDAWADMRFTLVPSFEPSKETVSEVGDATNDSVGTATSYTLGDEISAHLAKNDSADVYTFEMKKSGFVTLHLDSKIKGMEVKLNHAFKDVEHETEDILFGKKIFKYFAPAGTYYLSFMKDKDDLEYTGSYKFSVSASGLPSVRLKKLKNSGKGSLMASWKRSSNVSGYQLQYSTHKSFKKGMDEISLSGAEKSETVIDNLKPNRRYYVRVRTFTEDNNDKKHFSKWSKAKSLRLRKK